MKARFPALTLNLLWPVLGVVCVAQAEEGQLFTQSPEIVSAVARGVEPAAAEPADSTPSVGKPAPFWIWGAAQDQKYTLKTTFAGGSKSARLKATCDNLMTISLNGQRVVAHDNWSSAVEVDVQKFLVEGENTLTADVENQGGPAGFVLSLAMSMPDGKTRYVVSDDSWQAAPAGDSKSFLAARKVEPLGAAPWGDVFATAAVAAASQDFNVLPGFQVERLFTVPKEQLGSWVCITTDNRGRLIVSDQGELGLCRVTPPAIGSQEPTKVERLHVKMSSAQGMLYAFDSLYVCANGGPGSGLYRLKDTNGDDQYDEMVKLKDIRGGGEHGPHALRLSPDGKSIYVVCGNHTSLPADVMRSQPPQTMGGVREEPLRAEWPAGFSSRLQPNWDEDQLLPRQWDGNGHATGVLAPGGWVAKTDPEGKTWEVVSSGYRNAYDMDFNDDGELFVYDADMEWDMGLPWYRPTRVTHATSGSEFGWRSGTGKWPTYYVDSLPQVVDIGPGSPVGVTFGRGARFPAKYQKALYLCDWTFGTMYAVHLEPAGASYTAVKEEFLSRTPLPLTDAVVGADGALYFTVGGRGAQSELFRVTYVGDEPTDAVDASDTRGADLRALRGKIEQHHRVAKDAAKVIDFVWPYLSHDDRHIRYAARVALEFQDFKLWQDRALAETHSDALIGAMVALARQADSDAAPRAFEALERLDFSALSERQQLDLLRAWSLVFVRLGAPADEMAERLAQRLDPFFPARSDALNRELCNMLVFLKSPSVAAKTIDLLRQPTSYTPDEMSDLLARNPGYGGSIAAMLASHPETQKLSYAFALRNLRPHWTVDERVFYFNWLRDQHQRRGGASYDKFLNNIAQDAYENSTDIERLAVEASGARQPFEVPPLPKPVGPGKAYTLDDLLTLSQTEMRGRDFENGKKMYAAARCVICHRFQGEGGATGPDLTQAAGRFNLKDLSEAIVDPSKVVSDQYRGVVVETVDGKSYTGRVIGADADSITLLIDPEDATKTVTLKNEEIEQRQLSTVSLMPKDLLQALNQDEALDLLAYLLSRGNPQDARFQK